MLNKLQYYFYLILERLGLSHFLTFFNRKKKKVGIILRVDDFPSYKFSLNNFKKFDKIMKDYGVSYILGIIPFLSSEPLNKNCRKFRELTTEEIFFLRKGIGEGRIVPAMHGITHQIFSSKHYSEFIEKDSEKINKEIKGAKNYLNKNKIFPDIFIPPFNEFNKDNYFIFQKHFKVITGGPESIKYFGKIKTQKIENAIYFPSYFPYYLSKGKKIPLPKKIECVTIHWNDLKEKKLVCILKKMSEYIFDSKRIKRALALN